MRAFMAASYPSASKADAFALQFVEHASCLGSGSGCGANVNHKARQVLRLIDVGLLCEDLGRKFQASRSRKGHREDRIPVLLGPQRQGFEECALGFCQADEVVAAPQIRPQDDVDPRAGEPFEGLRDTAAR